MEQAALDLRDLRRRAAAHPYLDGLLEAGFGMYCMVIATGLTGGGVGSRIIIGFVVLLAVSLLKKKVAEPRIGFAVPLPPRPGRRKVWLLVLVAILVATGAALIALGIPSGQWVPWVSAAAGMVIAGGYTVGAVSSGLVRLRVHAVVSLVIGVGASLLPFENKYENVGFALLVMGAIQCGTGLIVFVRFLHRYPVRKGEVGHAGTA